MLSLIYFSIYFPYTFCFNSYCSLTFYYVLCFVGDLEDNGGYGA